MIRSNLRLAAGLAVLAAAGPAAGAGTLTQLGSSDVDHSASGCALCPSDAVYTNWCRDPAKKVDVCADAGWFKDFADPRSMLEPVFKAR